MQDLEGGIIIPMESYVPGGSCSNRQLKNIVSSSGNNQEWIRYQSEGSKVSRQLPRNWHKINDLLGFAIFSVHVPTHDKQVSEDGKESEDGIDDDDDDTLESDKESEEGIDKDDTWSLECELTIEDGQQLKLVVPFSC